MLSCQLVLHPVLLQSATAYPAVGSACLCAWSMSEPYPGTAAVQVPMFSASGLRVQYLKVWEKSSYKVDKWVRKVCRSGDYNVRI